MSESEMDLPKRLRSTGATELEHRLLDAASRERPSAELSERMAQAIGISVLDASGARNEALKPSTVAKVAVPSRALVPWLAGGALAAMVALGLLVSRAQTKTPGRPTVSPPTVAAPSASLSVVASASSAASAVIAEVPPPEPEASSLQALPPSVQRGRHGSEDELGNQIALVDAARSALASGGAARALAIAREYQTKFPSGTFRPEVSAVKIEALMKLGRTSEARTAAERFLVAYGQGPLADRVARIAGLSQP